MERYTDTGYNHPSKEGDLLDDVSTVVGSVIDLGVIDRGIANGGGELTSEPEVHEALPSGIGATERYIADVAIGNALNRPLQVPEALAYADSPDRYSLAA